MWARLRGSGESAHIGLGLLVCLAARGEYGRGRLNLAGSGCDAGPPVRALDISVDMRMVRPLAWA